MSELFRGNPPESDTNDTLPSGWRNALLAEVAEIRISNVDKKQAVGEIPIRLCNYIDVYKNVYITATLDFMEATATQSEIARFCVELGDVMITKDSETPDDIGVPAVVIWSAPKLVCGYHLALFKPHKDQVDSVFLAKQLRLPRIAAYYGRLACGSTRYGLSNSGIARTPIQLPPLSQQRKIARILTTVDNLIEKTEALIAKYQAIKQGMMHDLFTRGVDEHGQLRPPYEEAPELYKQSELGWIPREWAVVRCAEICREIVVGIVIQPAQYYRSEGIPVLRSANVRETGIDGSDLVFMSHESNRLLVKSMLRTGDVVTVRTGYPGTSCVVSPDFDGSNCIDIIVSRPGPRIRSEFLAIWINSDSGKNQVLRTQGGLAQQHFNVGELKDLLVVLPSPDEQKAMESILLTQQSRIHIEETVRDKLRLSKTGLMQDLLTGRVRVKLDEAEAAAAHA